MKSFDYLLKTIVTPKSDLKKIISIEYMQMRQGTKENTINKLL